jgi:FkbM family methyltransferase
MGKRTASGSGGMNTLQFQIGNNDRPLIDLAPQYLNKYTGPLDVVLDIGAHVGTFALPAAQRGAVVYAVEASPINFPMLVENIDLNGFSDRIHPMNLAVANIGFEKRTLRFVGGGGTGQRSLAFSDAYPEECTVMTVSLKDLLQSVLNTHDKIDYVKVDIEGAEWELLDDNNRELKEAIGRVNHWEVSIHPLDNNSFFGPELAAKFALDFGGLSYGLRMKTFLNSCGIPDNRMVIA